MKKIIFCMYQLLQKKIRQAQMAQNQINLSRDNQYLNMHILNARF